MKVQQPYKGRKRGFFFTPSIDKGSTKEHVPNDLTKVARALVVRHEKLVVDALDASEIGRDVKSSSPWIVKSGIGAFAQGWTAKETKRLRALTELPDEDDPLHALCDILQEHWRACCNEVYPNRDVFVREQLMSEGYAVLRSLPFSFVLLFPRQEPARLPFRVIQTDKKYLRCVAQLLVFTLRASDQPTPPFVLTEGQQQAMLDLRALLARLPAASDQYSEDGNEVHYRACPEVHAFLYQLFAHAVDGEDAYSSPVIAFSFLVTVDEFSGLFGAPYVFTPVAAALTFAARLVMYHAILCAARDQGTTPMIVHRPFVEWVKKLQPNVVSSLRRWVLPFARGVVTDA